MEVLHEDVLAITNSWRITPADCYTYDLSWTYVFGWHGPLCH